jgi:stress-induced morphogen
MFGLAAPFRNCITIGPIGNSDANPIITIEDLRGDGDHYACNVISSAFNGKNRVQQHQMVYNALGGRMGGELHALALQTSAPQN